MHQENLCVLIDFENIAAGTERENLGRFNTKLVMNHLKEKGRILLSRAYGDWGRFAKFKQSLLIQGISMMELTSYRGQDKNRADIALVVDAMELVYTRPHIQTFVLMSGDSDFTPLVMKLRELNKRIIGLGTRKATSRLLADSCDEFIFYDNLLKRSRTEEESTDDAASNPPSLTSQQAYSILVETLTALQRDEARPVSAGMVKQFILRKHPTFDETELGHNGFKSFLESAAKRDLVVLENNEKGGGYFVSILSSSTSTDLEQNESGPEYTNPLATEWFETLVQNGHHITNHLVRHTITHEFVDHVLERRSQQKRSTLLFTYGDVARRCRKTSPTATISEVEHVLNALQKFNYLIGHDKKPIRSKRANFVIRTDAEEMLAGLRTFYVQQLIGCLEDPSIIHENLEALSELLWNDTDHLLEVGQLLNQVQADTPSPDNSTSVTTHTEVNSDGSGVQDSSADTVDAQVNSETAKPKRKTTRKRSPRRSKKTATESTSVVVTSNSNPENVEGSETIDAEHDTSNESTTTSSEPTPPKKKRTRRTTTKKDSPVEDGKKPTRKRGAKKSQFVESPTDESSQTNPFSPTTDTED